MLHTESELKIDLAGAVEHFERVIKQLRIGRPNPEVFESLMVEAYKNVPPMELRTIASVKVPTASSVVIEAFDKSTLNSIADAITNSNLGYNPSVSDRININIPPMTEETRKKVVDELGGLLESSKISVRQIRHKFMEEVEEMKELGGVSEDEVKLSKEAIQKDVDATTLKLDELAKVKAASIMDL